MHIRGKTLSVGYNKVCQRSGKALMDVGKIYVEKGDRYECTYESLERAFLLIEGKVTLEWEGERTSITRESCFDDNPVCLHVPKSVKVSIIGNAASVMIMQGVENDTEFKAKIYSKNDCTSEQFGKDVMSNTSIRIVRTIIDDNIAPYSNLVIGEVINLPGRWSSYPPHHHVQPEVYMYRFLPEQGFGFSCEGEQVYRVKHGDSVIIEGGKVHPQTTAPGYAMYYTWLIPHLPKRWLKDREFLDEDIWLLEDEADIWEPNL